MYFKKVMGKKHRYEGTKAFLKGRKPGLFVNFGKFPYYWIGICIPNKDPDPDPELPNERIRLQNTEFRTTQCRPAILIFSTLRLFLVFYKKN
jgi:hypothetical protein